MHWSKAQSPSAWSAGRKLGSTASGSASSTVSAVRPNASRARTPRRTNSVTTWATKLCANPSAAWLGSNPIDVNSTASALTGPVGKCCARGTAWGGA